MAAYTNIEQSKKLLEIISPDTADMYYEYILPRSNKLKNIPSMGNPVESLEWFNKGYTVFGKNPVALDEYCIPCWSLQALIDEIPDIITNEQGEDLEFHIDKEDYSYGLFYENKYTGEMFEIETDYHDNFVDTCVEMIMKLYELKLL